MYGVDRKICHEGHWSASRGLPSDAEQWFRVTDFFIHTIRPLWYFFFWFTTFDFQRRTCYKVTLFPLKRFYSSLKQSTQPATAVRYARKQKSSRLCRKDRHTIWIHVERDLSQDRFLFHILWLNDMSFAKLSYCLFCSSVNRFPDL